MNIFIQTLQTEFEENANSKIALEQKAYMRNQFEYYGIKTPKRREITKPFLNKKFLPKKSDLESYVKILWQKPQRDYHYFAQELAFKYTKELDKKDIELFEFMVTHNSWWDTVDFIAPKLISAYFKTYPKERDAYIKKWIASENIWLQRSALLFQLKDKEKIDTNLLTFVIHSLINSKIGSKEFFINKAIGWILREYSKTNPDWVVNFVQTNDLRNLSRREALRLIKK
ncbi:DNA alkylation repair protein [Bernardetia sp. MNP-M8]|uniref:DNA alkylation repair protein n=1 Tax=Bernardetia sp. MNP-M8 TaxID=3127470 RepID=UPI0030CBD753